MTRLSLHHADENPNLSIHLREGQYCTVGSSAAADYSIRAEGIEPVHCRIGCQASGGYIECFNPFASICVNDVAKSRSRLMNGDRLRIGTVELKVDLPETKIKVSNFEVEFNPEDSPTTKVIDSMDLDDDEVPAFAEPPQTATPEESTQIESEPPVEQFDSADLNDEDDTDTYNPSISVSYNEPADRFAKSKDEISAEDDSNPRTPIRATEPNARTDADSKPKFQFDSTEPGDADLSQAELTELSKPESSPVTMGAVDLEGDLVDAIESESEQDLNESDQEDTEDEDTGPAIPGATCAGKYWKWNGQRAVDAVQELVDTLDEIKIYRSRVGQISLDQLGDISLNRLTKKQPAVFLISALELSDLQDLVRKKRWDDRIGHPQAVTMFLTFLPQRMLRDFFESIEACVLIHENDVELVRIRKSI